MTSRVGIIIPLFNESDVLPLLAERLHKVLPGICERQSVTFELFFVDDGSSDQSVSRLSDQSFDFPANVTVLSRNFGKESALSAGLDEASRAGVDAAVLMDADLQHPPELIENLIVEWRAGHELVYFFKQSRENEGSGKSLGSWLFYRLTNYGARFEIPADAGDFRLIDAKALNALCSLPERERFLKGLYAWIGYRQKGLPFEAPERVGGGGTKFGMARLLLLAIDGLTSFSIVPIRLLSLTGLLISLLSVFYILWIVGEYLIMGSPFSGFASIVVLITFFGGYQIFFIGLIGEYVGKSLTEAKQRPVYLVRDKIDLKK